MGSIERLGIFSWFHLSALLCLFAGAIWVPIAYVLFGFCFWNCSGLAPKGQIIEFSEFLANTTGVLWATAGVLFLAAALMVDRRHLRQTLVRLDKQISQSYLREVNDSVQSQWRGLITLQNRPVTAKMLRSLSKEIGEMYFSLANHFRMREAFRSNISDGSIAREELSNMRKELRSSRKSIREKGTEVLLLHIQSRQENIPFLEMLHSALLEYQGRLGFDSVEMENAFRFGVLSRFHYSEVFSFYLVAWLSFEHQPELRPLGYLLAVHIGKLLPASKVSQVAHFDLDDAMHGRLRCEPGRNRIRQMYSDFRSKGLRHLRGNLRDAGFEGFH